MKVLAAALIVAVAVTLVSAQGYKPGRCPLREWDYNSTAANCPENECNIDQDCEGQTLCCPNGCSRECIQPEFEVFIDTQAKMSAQVCEGASASFVCPKGTVFRLTGAFWGRGNSETCAEDLDDPTDEVICSEYFAFDYVADLCERKESCFVPASVGYFGDPCANFTSKYLMIDYYCQAPTYTAEMCEDSGKLPLACPDNKRLNVQFAFFGRDNNQTCPREGEDQVTNCSSAVATTVVQEMCDGKSRCELDAWTGHFGEPCSGTYKFLSVDYTCEECTNKHGRDTDCELWAFQGQCDTNPDWMLANCRKACWRCDTTPPACENIYFNDTACEEWVNNGDCYSDAAFMHTYCRRSCTGCDSKTECGVDKYDDDYGVSECPGWFSTSQCSQNMHYMFYDCTKSCFGCYTDNFIRCSNKYFDQDQCEAWANAGQCVSNPGFMIPNCFKACMGCTEDPKCENLDGDAQCDAWEQEDQCNLNPIYMHQYCWKSCMRCEAAPRCVNTADDGECERWARNGQCEINPEYMLTQCTKSCTRCGPVSEALTDCANLGANDTTCDGWADSGQCVSNPRYMIPNCRSSCSLCYLDSYRLDKVGADPLPGMPSDFTRSMTFILPGEVPGQAVLTHFIGFFVRPDPIYLQVWAVSSTGEYTLVYSQKFVPEGFNVAQTIAVDECVQLFAGDQVGFSTFTGMSAPIATNPIPYERLVSSTAYRRAASTTSFVRMLYPYEFSLSAGFALNRQC